MTQFFTKLSLLGLIVLLAVPVTAQDRDDIIWARDIGAATITLDGNPDEAAWALAETFTLQWGERAGLPGSGWRIHGSAFTPTEPDDPLTATIRVLRKGGDLYIAADVEDKSIGGSTGLWGIDALVISIPNQGTWEARRDNTDDPHLFPSYGEYIYGWWHAADTVAGGAPTPGATPRFHGGLGSGTPNGEVDKTRTDEDRATWDAGIVINGTTNDDTHGEDNGYVVEMKISLDSLGYDVTKPEGIEIPWSFTVYDTDYKWPVNADSFITTKVWWQSQWGNNLNEGQARIKIHPDVNLTTALLPEAKPDFLIKNGADFADPTIDGTLDETVWGQADTVASFGYKQYDLNNTLPGFSEGFNYFWFRPGANDAIVVDPSVIHMQMFYKGTKLYIGATVGDGAISGKSGEAGDGFSISMPRLDSLDGDNTLFPARFIFNIDSTGALELGGDIENFNTEAPGAVTAAHSLIGASTAADPSDVDEGYIVEIEIDLEKALGYPSDRGDGWLWIGAQLFDADDLEDAAASTHTRMWWMRERTGGPLAWGFMDERAVGTSVDQVTELPQQILLEGNYPNPFNPTTKLRYQLPESGDVSIRVFDVLGRQVALLQPGIQSAGRQEVTFAAQGLASGLYFYRLEVKNTQREAVQMSRTGRMILLK